jgi:hypothetical protein
METLNEIKLVNVNKNVNELIKATKDSAKGIFSLHRNVISLYVNYNKEYFEGFNVVTTGGLMNPNLKYLKNKEFKPFQLLYGTFTLDKVLKTIKCEDYLSFMELYNKSVLTYLSLDSDGQNLLLKRGDEINAIVKSYKGGKIGGITFISEITKYFSTFHENLKNGKVAPNVAKFLFENDVLTYDKLNIKSIIDVEHEEKRKTVKKFFGANGLVEFDNLIKENKDISKFGLTAETATETAETAVQTAKSSHLAI